MVGINDINFIFEPQAAIVAYDMDRVTNSERVIVFNLGATSVEVSAVVIENG